MEYKYIKYPDDKNFNYAMLARLLSDVRYYFGHGERNAEHALYYKNVSKHFDAMREYINALPETPENITLKDIDIFETCANLTPYKLNIKEYNRAKNIGYMNKSFLNDPIHIDRICGFLPENGTTLFYHGLHFIVVNDAMQEIHV